MSKNHEERKDSSSFFLPKAETFNGEFFILAVTGIWFSSFQSFPSLVESGISFFYMVLQLFYNKTAQTECPF